MKKFICIFLIMILPLTMIVNAGAVENQKTVNKTKDKTLWSEQGNFNNKWLGLTNYSATTEFYINNGADLAAFIVSINQSNTNTYLGKKVILQNDIDLSDHLWDMRGGISSRGGNGNFFSGTLDGRGHTISGMTIDYEPDYIGLGSDFFGFGLFSHLFNATVKNLNIQDTYFNIGTIGPSSPTGIGCLAGQISGTTVENVNVSQFKITTKPNNQQGIIAVYFGGLAGVEYCNYTRVDGQRSANTYKNCNVSDFDCTYSYSYFGNWKDLFGMGGLVGGMFPSGYNNGSFQSTINDCVVSNVTLNRDTHNLTAFGIEAYGGLMGFSTYPVQIINSHVNNFTSNIIMPDDTKETSPVLGLDPAVYVGGLVGYADYSSEKTGKYLIQNSSADGVFKTTGNGGGKLFAGGICGYSTFEVDSCYTQFDLSNLKDKSNVVYGNLFGKLDIVADITDVRNNIFNNFDYIATSHEIDKPSVGYLGEKLSTLAITGELNNDANIDLSQNWGILKFIMKAGEKNHPLEYVQCMEKKTDLNFYDYWKVDSYSHAFARQDSDTEQVTFSKGSGESTFLMNAQIISKSGAPTWKYIKDIIVLPVKGNAYTITYTPGTQGTFSPQKYSDLTLGQETPEFSGVPIGNTGWVFDGWNPVVTDSVIGNVIYEAQWKIMKYKVDYKFVSSNNPNGISVPPSVIVDHGLTTNKPKLTTPQNWQFDGWYLDKGCKQMFDFKQKITSDITLYGKWTYNHEKNPVPEQSEQNNNNQSPKTGDITTFNITVLLFLLSSLLLILIKTKRKD